MQGDSETKEFYMFFTKIDNEHNKFLSTFA